MDKPDRCVCCGFETEALVLLKWSQTRTDAGRWYCHLCFNSAASHQYEMVHLPGRELRPGDPAMEHLQTLRTICYVGNVILGRLRP